MDWKNFVAEHNLPRIQEGSNRVNNGWFSLPGAMK